MLFIGNLLSAQMLSKETGQELNRNARLNTPAKTEVVLVGQKFAAIDNQLIKLENATPTTGNTCRMQNGGTFQYLLQYDSLRALMMYHHAKPHPDYCHNGASFLMPIDEVFSQKRIIEPNATEIKKRLIRRNMQGH